MPYRFDLIITGDYSSRSAEFRLLDADGSQLAYHQTDFNTIPVSRWHGLFDLRDYLRLYVEEGKENAAVEEIGICIAEDVLGMDIFQKLWKSESQRTLRIQLPGAAQQENPLAAALVRVPWEIARPAPGQPTLGKRNLLVRVVHERDEPASQPIELAADEPLRVLFVFAEARGSRPLGARQERRELLRLFEREIYPQRRIAAHFLTHGVTRERLKDQIAQNGGYHVVHWSGHGHLNLLELARTGGDSDRLSGSEMLDLFTDAGGFLPRLVFLSACHSGDILRVKDWNDFLAVAEGKEPKINSAETKRIESAEAKQIEITEQPGFTGTAHALLQGGVPSVVAMRYAVGDDYARELAVEFYRALLAHAQPKNAATALTMARHAMLDPTKHDGTHFGVCDHATPVLYGAEQPGIAVTKGRSPELNPRNPRLQKIGELTTAQHEYFVGRTWELAILGSDFIGSSTGAEARPVAVITGLGGMGKTALVAEALALWETRFEWVLLYQAKPNPLGFEATLRDIHMKLYGELKRYHEHVRENRADEIYRDGSADFTGVERLERLTRNLIRALKDEPILLVLDNLETNLKPQPEPVPIAGQPVWACQDPAWDRCLSSLAQDLVGSPSRVLLTCRKPLAALADQGACPILLGPLPPSEAALYLRAHPALSRMVFHADKKEREIAERIFRTSRFHPLLMDRLARLAAASELRAELLQALDALEKTKDFARLPALFATQHGDAKELAYLDDALASSLDQLIAAASPDARRLLWMIAVANDPVSPGLLKSVWSGEESPEQAQLRTIKQMLEVLPSLPPDVQEHLTTMPPELRAMLDALPLAPESRPDIEPLLRHLVSVGLATEERTGPEDDNPDFTCHELVRERIYAWMEQHQDDRGELNENSIRLGYADGLAAVFNALQDENMTAALRAGSGALVYCVQAGDYDRLSNFASQVVTGTGDSRLLEELIPHLQSAANSAPAGRPRWSCLCYLADGLRNAGRPDTSLPFYEQAATLARSAAEAYQTGSQLARLAWSNVGEITGNWAGALFMTGDLDAAGQRRLEEAEAKKKAGSAAVDVVASELEALRIVIRHGNVAQALPQIEARLVQVETWWRRQCAGQSVPDAPNPIFLARTFLGALDIATDAHFAQGDWQAALSRIDAIVEVKQALRSPEEDMTIPRINRAVVLAHLRRCGEARAELEVCLQATENNPALRARVLSSLASLFGEQGDMAHAIIQERRALALCEQLPDPRSRGHSHGNLADYLERSSAPSALAESSRHQLAAFVYFLVAEMGQDVQTSLRSYAIDFRRSSAAGTPRAVPRVTELLADPAFRPLDEWLRQRQVDVEELQAAVDHFLEQARQAALDEG